METKKAMIEDNEFEKWVESCHVIFEIFEGRFDAYPLAKKWVDMWFENNKFTINENDAKRLDNLIRGLDYEAFRNFKNREEQDNTKWKTLSDRISMQFNSLIKDVIKPGELDNIGFGLAPYLFTWNFQRFKEYFKRNKNFSLIQYFQDLGKLVKDRKGEFRDFRNMKLIDDEINETSVIKFFNEFNDKLKEISINQNEPVGTAKIFHIISPYYFPLIDNKIAKAVGLKKQNESLKSSDYYKWMLRLKEWLQPRAEIINGLERKFNFSILKLVDQGFYVMSSINLSLRLTKLGIDI